MQRSLVLFAVLVAAGCTAGKSEPTDDFADLADAKADYFSYRLKLLGDATDGARVKYTRSPLFRGWSFFASANSQIDAWVRSSNGDAVAWLLDSRFRVIAKNDDADDSTYDARLSRSLTKDGTYYIVFRDYNYEAHYFQLAFRLLKHKPIAPAPSETSDSALRTAFLAVFDPSTWKSHPVVSESRIPVAAHGRVEQFDSFLGRAGALWQLPGGWALVSDWEDSRWFVDLYDSAGAWVDHGHDDYNNGTNLSWTFDDNDPSICSCSLAPSLGGTCAWMDGSLSGSGSIECD